MRHAPTIAIIGRPAAALGLVPNGKRTVVPIPANILAKVPKPTGKNENIKSYGADPVRDTVPLIQKLAKRQMWQGKKLAEYLKGKTVAETVRNNWDFFMKYIQYRKDPADSEQVRSLRRLVHNGAEGGDCDCFVNALSVLLLNQGIDFKMRVAKYNGSKNYSHIYIVVPTGNGKYITLDPVVHQFNTEAPYTDFKDFDMRLESLDGLGCACGGSCGNAAGTQYGMGAIQCNAAKTLQPQGKNTQVKRYFVSARQLENDGMVNMTNVLSKRGIAYVDKGDVLAIAGGKFVPKFAPEKKSESIAKQAETVVQSATANTNAGTNSSTNTSNIQAGADINTNNTPQAQASIKPGSIVQGILATMGILTAIRPV